MVLKIKQYYSDCGEDKWIDEHLNLPEFGVYVDLGCAHPTQHSNTAFLRDKGWEGVSVDANPGYAAHWSTPFVAAVLSDREEVSFVFHKNSLMSRVYDGVNKPNDASIMRVEARTVQSILDEFNIGKIDFMSIDLEGHEFEAFRTFDLLKHLPSVILAEFNTQGLGEDYRLEAYLTGTQLYRVVFKTESNMVFSL